MTGKMKEDTTKSSSSFWPLTPILRDGRFTRMVQYEISGSTHKCHLERISSFVFQEYLFRALCQLKDGLPEAHDFESNVPTKKTRQGFMEKYFLRDHKNIPARKNIRRVFVEKYEFGRKFDLTMCNRLLHLEKLTLMRHTAQQNPLWYLQEPLISLCQQEDGYCGQSCGCCERRPNHYPAMGMSGHCTWACLCCMQRKGINLKSPRDEKDAVLQGIDAEKRYIEKHTSQFRNSYGQTPSALLSILNAYFSEAPLQLDYDLGYWGLPPGGTLPIYLDGMSESNHPARSTSDDDAMVTTNSRAHDYANQLSEAGSPPPSYWEAVGEGQERRDR